ncbi:hypothetical protein [Yinghuangia soli]|uniref:GerMN domain-containing protein n=1 Tax=Yinghuangia soli TaxID=2908204 RepID=A0AA41Q1F5_9ACTN|nr:hypothetical protein [Yinghuangia soli]MCF2529795.1 hypothetical protein [Yinghuangia soli]
MSGVRRRPRTGLLVAGAVGSAVLLAGCGIRATEGPINAGDPATRPQGATATQAVPQHQIYLVREGRPQPVPRGDAVDLQLPGPGATRSAAAGDPLRMSQIDRLLRELAKGPNPEEAAQGWSTALPPGGVRLAEPLAGDPADLVRLDLDSFGAIDALALGQIVCTLQHASRAKEVPLAGRAGPGKPQQCAAFQAVSVGPPPANGKPSVPGSTAAS